MELPWADHYLHPVGAEGAKLADPRERLIDMIVPWIESSGSGKRRSGRFVPAGACKPAAPSSFRRAIDRYDPVPPHGQDDVGLRECALVRSAHRA